MKLAERIARELCLYESQLYTWRSKLKNAHSSSEREQDMSVEIARLKRQLAEQAGENVWEMSLFTRTVADNGLPGSAETAQSAGKYERERLL